MKTIKISILAVAQLIRTNDGSLMAVNLQTSKLMFKIKKKKKIHQSVINRSYFKQQQKTKNNKKIK